MFKEGRYKREPAFDFERLGGMGYNHFFDLGRFAPLSEASYASRFSWVVPGRHFNDRYG